MFGDARPTMSAAAARRIDAVCDRFEQQLQAGQAPCVEEFLDGVAETLRPMLLREILLLQWDYEHGQQHAIDLDGYLERFPAYSALIQAVALAHLSDSENDVQRFRQLPGSQHAVALVASGWHDSGYEILRQLGCGGMGTVLQAKERATDRLVAIKILRQDLRFNRRGLERFRAEVRALARLQHANIVQIFDVQVDSDEPFYSMEYCNGGSLSDELRRRRPTPHESALLIETLANAVHVAHEAGIIHRDLKPGNVLLQKRNSPAGDDGQQFSQDPIDFDHEDSRAITDRFIPKLADFGLAKDLSSEALTQTQECLGSIPYMAPEQLENTKAVGRAVDIHALGAILYECLTGRPPFGASTPAMTIQRIVSQDATPPRRCEPTVPLDLSAICVRCLEKNPADRYSSALELAHDLRRFLTREPTHARPVGAAIRLLRWGQRHPQQLAIMAGICGVFALVAAGYGWHSARLRDMNDRLLDSNQRLVEMTQHAEASQETPSNWNMYPLFAWLRSVGVKEM